MYEWSDEHLMIRDAMRDFVAKEIKPNLEELEHGDTPPYAVLRKMYETFGMGAMAHLPSISAPPASLMRPRCHGPEKNIGWVPATKGGQRQNDG